MRKIIRIVGITAGLVSAAVPMLFAGDKIRVVATTGTFADLVRQVGQDSVEVHAIAAPNRDIHFISPTPKDIVKLKKADVFVHGGLDLEVWRGPLLDAVGRREFLGAGEKAVDVSEGIQLIEIPSSLSRVQGDIHAFGNPHYWTDPENAKIIARNISDKFSRLFPERAGFFQKNANAFIARIDEKMRDWALRLAQYQGMPVVTYHNSWPYFLRRFGLRSVGQLEPKPGIPPTARHLAELMKVMRDEKVKVIIRETYQEEGTAKKAGKDSGAQVLTFLSQPAPKKSESADYLSMMETNVRQLETAAKAWKEERP